MVLVLVLVACSSPKEKMATDIKNTEEELFGDPSNFDLTNEKITDMISKYTDYAEQFPDDPRSADYLFSAAKVLRTTGKYVDAINMWDRIMTEFPDYADFAQCLFLQGFTYENNLSDFDKAGATYKAFLEKYPDHELTDDAEFSLRNLGKPAEEILEGFKKLREASEAAADSVKS